ncbi:Uncharacterized protein APZ42_007474, partial [Daphnia magna]
MLWLACRHHVYEVHIKHVSDAVTVARNSPSEGMFGRFQKEWSTLEIDVSDLALFEVGEYSDDINSIVNSVSAWGVELYENETFPREDYCELLELTLVYLGVPVFPFAFQKPGLKKESLDWMMVPLCYWEKTFGYSKIEEIIRGLEVVNDCAERAVKLITDFKDVCVNVEEQPYLFQVIEDH